ncbi:uncharacterized protein [Nicotiana tomentosiformis]|uniref:uncharacterized protein n=1 Tax=Nicotiana tomentosiformis TaxID=4098 RepID=UPI00388C97FD
MVKKILKAKQYSIDAGINLTEILDMENLSIKNLHMMLRGEEHKMPWRKFVCNNGGVPKWIFILYLAIIGKLSTRDRLARWGVTNDLQCPLCNVEEESIEHLFFKCTYAASFWRKLLQWMGITR